MEFEVEFEAVRDFGAGGFPTERNTDSSVIAFIRSKPQKSTYSATHYIQQVGKALLDSTCRNMMHSSENAYGKSSGHFMRLVHYPSRSNLSVRAWLRNLQHRCTYLALIFFGKSISNQGKPHIKHLCRLVHDDASADSNSIP